MKYITREELKHELNNGNNVTIIEALPEIYWREGHIPGSIQIDYVEINTKAADLLPDKDAKIVVYCANTECQNSTKAVRTLESIGYKNVFEYLEGKQDWADAGLPLISEKH